MKRRFEGESHTRVQEGVYLLLSLFFLIMVLLIPPYVGGVFVSLVDAGITVIDDQPYFSASSPSFSAKIGRSLATSEIDTGLPLDVLRCSIGNQERIMTYPLTQEVLFKADAEPGDQVHCELRVSAAVQLVLNTRSIDTIRVDNGTLLRYIDDTPVLVRDTLELRFVTFPGFQEALHAPWQDPRQVSLRLSQ